MPEGSSTPPQGSGLNRSSHRAIEPLRLLSSPLHKGSCASHRPLNFDTTRSFSDASWLEEPHSAVTLRHGTECIQRTVNMECHCIVGKGIVTVWE